MLGGASPAAAVGNAMFDIGTITGEKPQSKIWAHDGSWWAVLDGPDGVAIFEKNGSTWNQGAFVDAVLTTGGGAADVLWNGTNLFVLVYSNAPKLYKYSYDAGLRTYDLLAGFPVNVPNPSGSETMTFDQDSTGRLWATAEGGGNVNVYHSTTSNHQSWSSAIVLRSGLDADDITAVVAFGGNRIGVMWSDQGRGEYGFRVHNDSDAPGTWQSIEIVDSGSGVADDHLNLATDSTGRIWCSTKNESDELQVHRRSTSGTWTTEQDATGTSGTRPIVMVNEDDDLLYLIYVNWDVDPRAVYYQTASLNSLSFGNQTAFLTHGSQEMNDPTGTKQVLPQGNLMCIATLNDSEAWWNGFGDPPDGGGGPDPTPPVNLVASLQQNPTEVDLAWDEPSSGTPDGYNVFRQGDGGAWILLNAGLLTSTGFTDTNPPAAFLCYRVTAETDNVETAPSNSDCVDLVPPAPPDNLVASLQQDPDEVDLNWDEPSTGAPDGYNVYRQVDGGSYVQINGNLVTGTSWTDTSPPQDPLCYQVTAETNNVETAPSNADCVDNTPPQPPEAPENLVLSPVDPGSAARILGFPFDEGTGDLVGDISGLGHHGWRGTTWGADAADPGSGSDDGRTFLSFDGIDDRVQLPDGPAFDLTGSFTLELRVRPSDLADAVLLEKGLGSTRTFSLRTTDAGEVTFLWTEGGGTNALTSTPVLTSGTWSHVAAVYDENAGENRLYVDGVRVQTASASGTPTPNDVGLHLGTAADGTAPFAGDLDDVHVFAAAVHDVDFAPPAKAGTPQPRLAVGGAGVLLEWEAAASGEPAVSWNVYRTVDQTTTLLNTTPLTTTGFLDADSLSGDRCYEITALSHLGLESNPSPAECIEPGPVQDPPAAPEQLDVVLVLSLPESVHLSWQAPSQGSTPSAYHVYRSVNGAFPQRLTTQPLATLSWVDSTLAAGSLCYAVRGVVADGREGAVTADSCLLFEPPPPSQPQFVTVWADSTPAGPASGVAAWRMNENGGQSLEDATGNGHTGQRGDDPAADSSDPAWVAGVSGSALQFDGIDDHVVVADAADLRIAGSFTVEAWFKLTGTGDHAILSKGGSQERNYWIILEGGAIDFRWETAGGANHGTTSDVVVEDDEWHHVACVYDMQAGEDRIYLDGVLVQQASDSGTPVTSADPLYIGARISSSSLTDEFDGCIDLVRISSSALYTQDFTPPADYTDGNAPTTRVNLSWQAPASGYTTSYKVYRSVDAGAWTLLDSTVTMLGFEDTTLDSIGPLVCYQVAAVDGAGGQSALSPTVCIGDDDVTSVWDPADDLARAPRAGLRIGPNPFNPRVRIQFDLVRPGPMSLRIYDVRGRLVDTLWDGVAAAGPQSHVWDGRTHTGRSVASGTYFVVLRAPDRTEKSRITLVR